MPKEKSWKQRDPEHALEAAKYEQPVPSRAYILRTLEQHGAPMSFDALWQALGVHDESGRGALVARLRAMERDGQLIRNRREEYCLVTHIPVVTGRVLGHRDGYGFLVPDQGGDDVYLSPRQMRVLMHGDRAAVRVSAPDGRGRAEGALVEVLERNEDNDRGPLSHGGRTRLRRPRQHAHRAPDHHPARQVRGRGRRPARRRGGHRPADRIRGAAGTHRRSARRIRSCPASRRRWPSAASACRTPGRRTCRTRPRASATRSQARTSATASTCDRCRSSRSTASTRATSTTRCTASPCAAAGDSSSRSRTSRTTCVPAAPSIARRTSAARRCTSRVASCRCCPKCSRTGSAR